MVAFVGKNEDATSWISSWIKRKLCANGLENLILIHVYNFGDRYKWPLLQVKSADRKYQRPLCPQ